MATQAMKRKAIDPLEDGTKRLRIEASVTTMGELSSPIDDDDDEDVSEYNDDKVGFSDDDATQEGGLETPVTPFSPTRKKFPSEYKTIHCTFPGCPKTFNRPARMKAHLVTHSNQRPYSCPFEGCDKTYIEDKHLQQHIKGTHTQERKWVCDWEGCGKAFLTGTRLRRHMDAHKGQDRFRCTDFPPCNKTFRKHQTLQRHIRSDHLELAPFPCTYVDPITKEQCSAGFDGSVGLRKHVEREHSDPQFVCSSCLVPNSFGQDGTPRKLVFKTEKQLQAHIRKEHAECMFCDKKCASTRELEKHIESQHSGKTLEDRKTVPCTHIDCGKSFTKKSNLEAHIRSAHNGERFICGTFDVSSNPTLEGFNPNEHACGKDFTTKISLEDHIRTAHLNLSRIPRSKTSPNADLINNSDDDFAPKQKKRKSRKQKANVIDELLGDAYAADPARHIACLDPICPHRFTREYDLQLHMRAAHPMSMLDPSLSMRAGTGAVPAQMQNTEAAPFMQAPPSHIGSQSISFDADTDWDLQRQALEGGPFWIGADAGADADANANACHLDPWKMDEEEMRKLIDPDIFGM